MSPFGKSRTTLRACVLQHHHGVFVNIEVIVDLSPERFVAIKYERLAAVPQQVRRGCCLLDNGPVWGEVSVQDRSAAFWVQRLRECPDQFTVANLNVSDFMGHCASADGECIAMQ